MEKPRLPGYLKNTLIKLGKKPQDLTGTFKTSFLNVMSGVKRVEDRALLAEMSLRKHFRMKELTVEDVAHLKGMGKAIDKAFDYSSHLVGSWRTAVCGYYNGLRKRSSEKEALEKIKSIASKNELEKWAKH